MVDAESLKYMIQQMYNFMYYHKAEIGFYGLIASPFIAGAGVCVSCLKNRIKKTTGKINELEKEAMKWPCIRGQKIQG